MHDCAVCMKRISFQTVTFCTLIWHFVDNIFFLQGVGGKKRKDHNNIIHNSDKDDSL